MEKINLILLDIAMPHLDGFETLKIIREKSNVPVIIATGYPVDQVSDQFNTIANVSFIQKPYVLKELKGKVQEVIHSNLLS